MLKNERIETKEETGVSNITVTQKDGGIQVECEGTSFEIVRMLCATVMGVSNGIGVEPNALVEYLGSFVESKTAREEAKKYHVNTALELSAIMAEGSLEDLDIHGDKHDIKGLLKDLIRAVAGEVNEKESSQ